ncbi:MAG: dephospho-CoA kinase, partial [Gammaproteobacteria bacterium]|nr:dephospho-CoA kinase [Gammaproteobacteria bacterium]
MFKVGLTGGIASGKSTVCQLFSQYGIPVIDADSIARQLVDPGQDSLKEIVQTFSTAILQTDGTLNRAAVRQLIFSDPK